MCRLGEAEYKATRTSVVRGNEWDREEEEEEEVFSFFFFYFIEE